MDNETKKMFETLINKLDNISEKQNNMDESLKRMGGRQGNIEKSLKNMDKRQKNMEIRQDEIFSVVKAIEHSNTTRKAEIDNITYKVAHTDGIINKIGNVIIESRTVI